MRGRICRRGKDALSQKCTECDAQIDPKNYLSIEKHKDGKIVYIDFFCNSAELGNYVGRAIWYDSNFVGES